MNIPSVAYINDGTVATTNQTKVGTVVVWCTMTGKVQVLNTRAISATGVVEALGQKYKERFTSENPAN